MDASERPLGLASAEEADAKPTFFADFPLIHVALHGR